MKNNIVEMENENIRDARYKYVLMLRKKVKEFNNYLFPGMVEVVTSSYLQQKTETVTINKGSSFLENIARLLVKKKDQVVVIYHKSYNNNYKVHFYSPNRHKQYWGYGVNDHKYLNESIAISEDNLSIYELVKYLRDKQSVPISFIGNVKEGSISIDKDGIKINELLKEITTKYPEYRFGVFYNKLVLYKNDPEYHLVAHRISYVGTRKDIFEKLLISIQEQHPDSKLPKIVYKDILVSNQFDSKVNLVGNSTFLEHLVELIHRRPNVYFNLLVSDSGDMELAYEEIRK